MPSILGGRQLVARAQQVTGAAQLIISGSCLYWGARIIADSAPGPATFFVYDGLLSGAGMIDVIQAGSGLTAGTHDRACPIRVNSGLWVDGSAAANGRAIIYYTPLEWLASIDADLPHDFFIDVTP